jgi:glycerol-3-phosphate dehydrogenase (NAD(P)+)
LKHLAVLGAGSWGTSLAVTLAPNFETVGLWMHDAARAEAVQEARENAHYLPGIPFPDNLGITDDARLCLEEVDLVLVAVPSTYIRLTVGEMAEWIPKKALIVSATKGLEPVTLLRMSSVIAEATGVSEDRVLALSGPSFASEVAQGLPAAVVVAGRNEPVRRVQPMLARPAFRVYSSDDIVGVEMGGALKNVVAIGAGMASGLGLGHNAVAALITRGLAEITRLAAASGAQPRTLSGLAGLGDLVLTCSDGPSRNRRLGIELTQSNKASDVLKSSQMTTEGVRTASVAVELGTRFRVEMPIAAQVSAVLESGRSPTEAIRQLMERSLKEE